MAFIKVYIKLPSLTRSAILSPSVDIAMSFDSNSSKLASGIFSFWLIPLCFQAFTQLSLMFSQISIDYVSSLQIGQKHVSFLLSNENTFWKVFVLIECKSQVPWIVLASYGIDLSISWTPICQKNMSNINNFTCTCE